MTGDGGEKRCLGAVGQLCSAKSWVRARRTGRWPGVENGSLGDYHRGCRIITFTYRYEYCYEYCYEYSVLLRVPVLVKDYGGTEHCVLSLSRTQNATYIQHGLRYGAPARGDVINYALVVSYLLVALAMALVMADPCSSCSERAACASGTYK